MKIKKYLFLQTGMTLIEVMIVVAIIAFLAVLVTGYLRSQVFKGNDARRKADMKRIGIAMEEYEKDVSIAFSNPNESIYNKDEKRL